MLVAGYSCHSRCLSLVLSITLLVCEGITIAWLRRFRWSWALRTRGVSTEALALVCGDMVVAAAACDVLVCVVVQCAGALCGMLEGGLPLCRRHMPKSSQASCAKTSAGVHPLPSHGNNKSTHGSIDYPRHGAVSYDAPLSPHVNS
jgi:hypothetical protein